MSDSGVAESEEGTDSPKDSAEVSSSMPCCSWEDSPSGPGAGCFQQRDQEAPVLGGSCRRGRRRGQKNRTPGFYYRGAADNEGRRVVKNARERTRVRNINVAYTELRQMLGDDFKKKNNKLRTLNATIEYIECLFSEKKRLRAAPPCKNLAKCAELNLACEEALPTHSEAEEEEASQATNSNSVHYNGVASSSCSPSTGAEAGGLAASPSLSPSSSSPALLCYPNYIPLSFHDSPPGPPTFLTGTPPSPTPTTPSYSFTSSSPNSKSSLLLSPSPELFQHTPTPFLPLLTPNDLSYASLSLEVPWNPSHCCSPPSPPSLPPMLSHYPTPYPSCTHLNC